MTIALLKSKMGHAKSLIAQIFTDVYTQGIEKLLTSKTISNEIRLLITLLPLKPSIFLNKKVREINLMRVASVVFLCR